MNTDPSTTKTGSEDFGNMMWSQYNDRAMRTHINEEHAIRQRKARENFLCLVAFLAIMGLAVVL